MAVAKNSDFYVHVLVPLQVDSLKGIQARLPELATQTLSDPELFRDLYRFTFKVEN